MKNTIVSTSLVILTAIAIGTPTLTRAEEALSDAILNGKPLFDVRYRFEHVDQQGRAKNAEAHTVRTRIGSRTITMFASTMPSASGWTSGNSWYQHPIPCPR